MKKTLFFITLLAGCFIVPNDVFGCTSWMVFADLTGNNTNILHKNRDSASRKIVVSSGALEGKYKWIALGSGGANIGFNSSGLAGAMNSGEKCIDPPDAKGRKSTPRMLQVILESCNSAAQAVEKLQQLVKAGDYSHGKSGSIFFFMDKSEGYVCETTGKLCSAQRFDCGYTVRASIWQNPNMYQYTRNDIDIYLRASSRAYIAMTGLNRMLDEYGKITLQGIIEHSRNCVPPEKSPFTRSICGKTTNSAASVEIDKQYPEVLSTMYAAIGHPRHTVYVPIPIGTDNIPVVMKNRKWSMASFNRLDQLKLEAPLPEQWIEFEKKSMAQYAKAKDEARKLLDKGKKDDAVKLLNKASRKIWYEAATLLDIKTKKQ